MRLNKWRFDKVKIGARILKTGVSIVLSLYIAIWLGLPTPVLAAVGATFAIQPTVYKSYLSLIEQLSANTYGAVIAIILVLAIGNDPIIIGIGAIITILVTLKTKNESHIATALVTMIVIMEVQEGSFINFALLRFFTIMVGVIAAFIVNLIFLRPKYESRLFSKINDFTEEILNWLDKTSRHNLEFMMKKKDIDLLKESLRHTERLYFLFEDDMQLYKKKEVAKARKLVVYRQMMVTSRRAIEVLWKFHRHGSEFKMMPTYFQEETQNQLDILMAHHRQIHLNLSEKVEAQKVLEKTNLFELMNLLAELKKMKGKDDLAIFHMVTLVSAMFEYGEHLQRLQMLQHSYQTFHDKDNLNLVTKED